MRTPGAGRTQFVKMLDYLKKHESTCKIILVEKTDRLYRNLKDRHPRRVGAGDPSREGGGGLLSDDSRSSEKFMQGIKVGRGSGTPGAAGRS